MNQSYSLLVPDDHAQSAFCGYLKIGQKEYRMRIKAPQLTGKRKRVSVANDSRYPMDFSSPTVFSSSSSLPSSSSSSSSSTSSESKQSLEDEKNENLKDKEAEFLWVEPALLSMLSNYSNILKQRQKQCVELSDLLVETQLIASRALATAAVKPKNLPSPEFYSALLKDISEIGWDRLVSLDPSLSLLSFAVSEPSSSSSSVPFASLPTPPSRVHHVEFKLPADYPKIAPVHVAHCPEPLEMEDTKLVADLVHKYAIGLPRFAPFWEVMEDLDRHTWVLEPAHPNRACRFRRVALGNNLSLHIEVDPSRPYEVCECSFFGADAVVAPLRARWFANQHLWNSNESPRINLERLLSTNFPPNTARSREEFNLECGICYSYIPPEGEGIPDQMCENIKCGRGFHHACLRDWLRAVPSSRQSFQTLFGECPYCSEPLSISISKTD